MFKQFDIDYDKVTFDGVILYKPSYLSVSQWVTFWQLLDGESVEEKMTISFDKGYNTHKEETDKEVEQIKNANFNEFKALEKHIDKLIENTHMNSYEKLIELKSKIKIGREEIWRL